MSKSVKLADIGKVLGVSTVTVSKALSGQKGVSEEMRAKIKTLAAELGYKSPSLVRLSRLPKSYNIGVLIEEKYLEQAQSFYWTIYQEVATRAVAYESFTLMELISEEMKEYNLLPRVVKEEKVDAFVVIGSTKTSYLSYLSENTRIPFICLDFYEPKIDVDSVITNSYFDTYKLTNYLCDNGHKKIAYVGSLLCASSITDRYFGYRKSLLEHGIEVPKDYLIDDRSKETGLRGPDFKFKFPKDMPTAFVCNCDLVADLLISELNKKGYKVPEDISIVGYDNYLFQPLTDVEITTFEVDVKGMVECGIDILMKKLSRKPYSKGMHVIEGKMVIKNSVRNIG